MTRCGACQLADRLDIPRVSPVSLAPLSQDQDSDLNLLVATFAIKTHGVFLTFVCDEMILRFAIDIYQILKITGYLIIASSDLNTDVMQDQTFAVPASSLNSP